MRLSSLADYAIVMMSAAARHRCGTRLSATLLSAETGVPLPTAQKLMQRLAGAGLLSSLRGTGGGFKLTRPAAAITLADIVEAIEGPIAMTICVDETRHDCVLDGHCQTKAHWPIVNGAVRGALSGVSLMTLAHPPLPVRPEPVEGLSFAGPAFEVKSGASTSSARTDF